VSYRTQPYVPFTLFLPNPFKSYEIGPDRLTGRSFGRIALELRLPPMSVARAPGAVQWLLHTVLNCGSLAVTDDGGAKHLIPRIRNVTEFRSALAGSHSKAVTDVETGDSAIGAQAAATKPAPVTIESGRLGELMGEVLGFGLMLFLCLVAIAGNLDSEELEARVWRTAASAALVYFAGILLAMKLSGLLVGSEESDSERRIRQRRR
jgi:hypothetical protein